MTLAGLYSALRVAGGRLAGQTVLCLGAGEAATGICDLIVSAMAAEGLEEAELYLSQGMLDEQLRRHGLVFGGRPLCTVLRPRLTDPGRHAWLQRRVGALVAVLKQAGPGAERDIDAGAEPGGVGVVGREQIQATARPRGLRQGHRLSCLDG